MLPPDGTVVPPLVIVNVVVVAVCENAGADTRYISPTSATARSARAPDFRLPSAPDTTEDVITFLTRKVTGAEGAELFKRMSILFSEDTVRKHCTRLLIDLEFEQS
jgi:hypothetical protein